MKISEQTSISMPMKNLISIIGAVAIGVWAYFGVTEKLNNHSTKLLMIETVFALILVLKGEVVEHTYKDKLSSCMKSARIAKKEVNPANVRFICKQVKAETEIYMGAKKILRIIDE